MSSSTTRVSPEDEAVSICRDLIKIDSTNYGDGSGPCEREAAEYVMASLREVGYEAELFESAPRRANVVMRIPGTDPGRDALVVHGHTDVVPARASEWSVDPFSAEIIDGMIWGRGAVDMKDMDAMILAVVRDLARTGERPYRDLIVAFFADEEAGGQFGSGWCIDNRPELFAGATEAISEVGGFSVELGGKRTYLIQTAEKGLAWLRLLAKGTAGHGSQLNSDNAVTHVAEAMYRIGTYPWPLQLTPTVSALLQGAAELTGLAYDPDDPEAIATLVGALGGAAKFVGATTRTWANPTQLQAGYKANVIPGEAEAVVDLRALPGDEENALSIVRSLAGDKVDIDFVHHDMSLEIPFEGDLVDQMAASLQKEDPGSVVLPYMLSAGTDNKALSKLGIRGYGFVPLRLPSELDFSGMFHGVDERVPVESVRFGTRVLGDFLRRC